MPTIEEIRQKYPQYDDMSDRQLADALHERFYSDIPRADFDKKIGLSVSKTESALRGAADTATFGYADEIAGTGASRKTMWEAATDPERLKRMNEAAREGDMESRREMQKEIFEEGRDASAQRRAEYLARNEQASEDNPVSYFAGQVGGALASAPLTGSAGAGQGMARMVGGGAIRRGAVQGATEGAIYGAAYGSGSSDEGQRVEGALTGGAVGGAFGGALGGAIAGAPQLARRMAQRRASTQAAQNEVVQAGERIGVELPRAAVSDSRSTQQIGKTLSELPVAGTPLQDASRRSIQQLDDAARNVEQAYGSGSVAGAGSGIRGQITETAKVRLPAKVAAKYDAVDALVRPNVVTKLNRTEQVAGDILARRSNAAIRGNSPAVSMLEDALAQPNGLNYQGIKDLRTYFGGIMKDKQRLVAAGFDEGEAKMLYGALTDDLRNSVERSGGKAALSAFEKANAYAARVARKRENLEKILGTTSDEGLVSRLQAMASNKSNANIKMLRRARSAVDPDTWDELASAILANMGRDQTGAFTPDRFVTAWGKLSESGRAALFGSTGRRDLVQALDDIVTVSTRFRQLNQMANSSGTGRSVATFGAGAGFMTAPLTTLSTIVGGRALASYLAQPATARQVAQWSQAYYTAASKGSKLAMMQLQRRAGTLAPIIAKDLGLPVGSVVKQLSGESAPALAEPEDGDQSVQMDPQRLMSPRLTEDDRESPLPPAMIDDGKAAMESVLR